MKLRILFSLAMLACLHAQAQELLTAEKLWSMGRIGEVAVSPNGTQIAYTLTFYNVADNKGNTDIYITNLKGDKTNRVTTTPESEFNIEWKNDATLCYISPKNCDTQVYQSNINGTETKLLTNIKGGINGFKLDPTGKKILYIADVKLDQSLVDKYPDLPKAEAKVFDDLMYRHWNQWHG